MWKMWKIKPTPYNHIKIQYGYSSTNGKVAYIILRLVSDCGCLPELLRSTNQFAREEFDSYWGVERDGYRSKFETIMGNSWEEIRDKAQTRVAEVTLMLKEVYKANKEKDLNNVPQTEEFIIQLETLTGRTSK